MLLRGAGWPEAVL